MNLGFISPEEWENSSFAATVSSITIASPPVVEFTVVDNQGRAVEGFEKLQTKAATATVGSYPNLSFAIAKLMPRTDSQPATWVSYIVTSVNATTGALSATRPSTDN